MARIGINTGSIANDGTGDTLRAAGGIINSNFLELYTYLGAGSTTTLSAPIWSTTSAGINTLRNVGIGTTNPRFLLEVGSVGASGTSLHVNGNARITGILTVGSSSVTIDGSLNKITVGSGITIDGATGIISATAFYVGGSAISGSTGAGTTWAVTSVGIHTTKNVGIGTTNPTSALTVKGNTSLETLSVSGVSTFSNTIVVGTGKSLTFGDAGANYLKLYSDGSNTYINQQNMGKLIIDASGTQRTLEITDSQASQTMAKFIGNGGAVELYYGGAKKIETLGTGVTVTGTTFTNQLSVSGVSTIGAVGAATTNLVVNGYATIDGVTISGQGYENTFIGENLPPSNLTSGNSNVAIGADALKSDTSGDGNVAIGKNALQANTSSHGNTAVGFGAGYYNTGQYNVYFGSESGRLITSGSYNSIIGGFDGNSNGLDIRTSSNNVVLSDGAGNIRFYANSSGNVGLGTTNPTSALTVKGNTSLETLNVSGNTNSSGIITASSFVGDGSGLTGVVGSGSGVIVKSNGSLVGTAGTIDFGNNISVSPISAGIVTVSISQLSDISVSGISTLGTVKVSSGVVTATSGIVTYYGDVSNAIDGRWTLGANGSSDYTFTGIGFTQTTNDPVLYLTRGKVYEFINNSGGSHPFQIRVGYSGAAYDTGVTNNGAASGTIRFEVPLNAPSTLYYQCTNHAGMGNQIYVLDQGSWVTTTVGIHTLSNVGIGITNPTSKLTVTGDGYISGVVTATSFVGSGLNLTGVTTNFTAAGSNAITRTFNTKLREFISVKDYGATGDGSTDDTTYIQNAIDSISANGGSIYFPQGTYKITSPLTVSNNTSIFGTGQTSKIQPGVGVTAILTYSATSNVTVEKLHFDGINTTNLTALYFPGGINNQFVHVSDCLFASMNRGIEMATDSFVVANNYAIDANTFFYGSDSSLNGSIHSNYILGGQYSVHLKQSGAQQAEGVRIFDNTFLNTSANALSVFVEAGLEIEIFDNIIDQVGSYGYSVYCSPAAGKSISSVKVLNNWCDSGNVGGSVYFYNCNQLIVDSNTFASSSGIGTALTIKSGNQYSSTKNICLNAFSNVVDYSGSVNQYQTGNVYSPSVGAATSFERNIFENDLAVGLSTARGVILTSPNGTKYRLHVLNDGTLRTISVT